MTTLIISNEEMNGTIDTVKYLEESCSLNKSVSKRIENEAKEKKSWISQHVNKSR